MTQCDGSLVVAAVSAHIFLPLLATAIVAQPFRLASDPILCVPHLPPEGRYRTTPVVWIRETCTRELEGSHCDSSCTRVSNPRIV